MGGSHGTRGIISRPGYIFFEGGMALLATYCRNTELGRRLDEALSPTHVLARASSWDRFLHLIRERPVAVALVDLGALSSAPPPRKQLAELRWRFPNLGLVLLVRADFDPGLLFQVGRTGIRNVVLMETEGARASLVRGVARARMNAPPMLVTRSLSPYLPRREARAVYLAMDGVHCHWSAEEYADRVGLSRPFLSECLKGHGLPSVGHLLLWSRLLHAGHWLVEPGRTAESVSRQLEYSSGAAFRRALKNYTGATPTEVIERGGLRFVLSHFRRECGLGLPRPSAVA